MLIALLVAGRAAGEKATGPLRVHPTNPRYFTDGSGKAVYLTGFHTWGDMQDVTGSDDGLVFLSPGGFDRFLDWVQRTNNNFIRMWVTEHTGSTSLGYTIGPVPWPRTGPGNALDGKPKFNLSQLDPAFLDRLRQRCLAAQERGIYVSIMFFQIWAVYSEGAWGTNPFNKDNNVNGINGDPNGDGKGEETHTLSAIPAEVLRVQEAYLRQVVDTVNDLDNVLYEICNEGVGYSVDWQYHLIRYLQDYQSTKPRRHPVGMTSPAWGTPNRVLLDSPADWVSLASAKWDSRTDPYACDPPAADGGKVSILDSDHVGVWMFKEDPAFARAWVWKSFTRGHNPIWMDDLSNAAGFEAARQAMGHTRTMADKMNLADMVPRNDLASTEYCLASPGKEYLVYLPEGGGVTVDLSAATGEPAVEWMHPVEGTLTPGGTVTGGEKRTLRAPFGGDAVVHVRKR